MSVTLQTVSSGYNLSAINANFQSLQNALNNNILWRTGNVAGEAKMSRDLDMDGNNLLNIGTDLSLPGSLITVGEADLRYYNIIGDVLEGNLDAGQYRLTNLAAPSAPFDATRKQELDGETLARQNADANLQSQMTGNVPLEASAFSQISWHNQNIPNSVNIPANKNAWSFGPQMEIEEGQAVTIGAGSSWTIANGRVVEDEDLHQLIADTLRTSDGSVLVQVDDIGKASDVSALSSRMSSAEITLSTHTGQISSLTSRMTAEEGKVQSVAQGGTGATSAAGARSNLGAAASGANSDITSLSGLTTPLSVSQGGTGANTAAGARTSLDAFQNTGVVDGSNAATGKVGEFLSNTGTATNATSAASANYATLTLTAGDWEVSGSAQFNPTGGTNPFTQINASISLVSATGGGFPYQTILRTSFNANGAQMLATPIRRVSVSTSTTVYLVAGATFPDGTMPIQGFIQARRIR